MSVSLSKEDLEKIKNFRYKTNDSTPIEKYFYNYFWDFIANHMLPDWLAPNLLTLMGLFLPLVLLITICIYSPDFGQTLPHWVVFLGFAAHFWYQTIDAVDGK